MNKTIKSNLFVFFICLLTTPIIANSCGYFLDNTLLKCQTGYLTTSIEVVEKTIFDDSIPYKQPSKGKREPIDNYVRTGKFNNYFSKITMGELLRDDEGYKIVNGMNSINVGQQIESLSLIIIDVLDNDDKKVREYVYDQLLEVDYKGMSRLMRLGVYNTFNNFNDPDQQLQNKLKQLKKKLTGR